MLRLKSGAQNKKLKQELCPDKVCSSKNSHLGFSLEMLTDSKKYTFDYFASNVRNECDARKYLDALLKEVSSHSWIELGKRGRKQLGGFEKIPYDSCTEAIFKRSGLTPDANIWSFTFGTGISDYRMLAYKYSRCDILYILGFDFDHSVYNHGS